MAGIPPGIPPDVPINPPATTPVNPQVTMSASEYQQINDTVASLNDRMASLSGEVLTLTTNLTAALKVLNQLGKGAEAFGTDFKDIANRTDDVKETYNKLLDLQRRSGILMRQNVRTYGDLKDHLEDIKKSAEDISTSGALSPAEQKAVKQYLGEINSQLKAVEGSMGKLGKTSKDALDPKTVADVTEEAEKLNHSLLNAASNFRKLGQAKTAFGKSAQNIRQNLPILSQGRYNPLAYADKYRSYGDAAQKIRSARDARMMAEGAGGGGGWMGRLAGGGGKGGGGGAGGGGFFRGPNSIGSKLGGLMEGGAAMGAEAIGAAAIPLGILEAIKEVFDTVQERNKTFEAGLAGGGVFSTTKGGFAGPTGALTPTIAGSQSLTGAYSGAKNLRVAQAMISSGLSVADLARGGRPPEGGFTQGIMGQFQKNVYTTGRVAGFSEADTVKQTVKLLQEYRQAMTTSGDFFINVDKAAKAAGMSSIKYVSILDDITSGFGRLNKSFNDTMNAMQLLSRTGANSAEEVQTYVKSLTGAGQQINLSTRAFLMTNMTPQRKEEMVRERNFAVTLQQGQAKEALEKLHLSGVGIENLKTPADVDRFMAAHVLNKGLSPLDVQSISSPMKQLAQELTKQAGVQKFAAGQMSPLEFAQFTQATGLDMKDTTQAMGQTMDQINDTLRKSGQLGPNETFIQKARTNPSGAYSSLLASGMADALGIKDETGLKTYVESLSQAAESVTQAVGQGTLPGGATGAAKIYDMVSDKLGLKNVTATKPEDIDKQKQDIIQEYYKANDENAGNLTDAVSQAMGEHTENLGNILTMHTMMPTDAEKTEAQKTAEAMEQNTRTTTDMMKQLVDSIIQLLVPTVQNIAADVHEILQWLEHPVDIAGKKLMEAGVGSGKGIVGALTTSPVTQGIVALGHLSENLGDVGYKADLEKLETQRILSGKDSAEQADKLGQVLQQLGALPDPTDATKYQLPADKNQAATILDILQSKDIKGMATVGDADKEGKKTVTIINTTNNLSVRKVNGDPAGPQAPTGAPGTEVPTTPTSNPAVTTTSGGR
jgi:hypothetical protein